MVFLDKTKREERLHSYAVFSTLFFDLPDETFVDMLKSISMGDLKGSEGSALLVHYVDSIKEQNTASVLQDLRVDRTHLLLGAVGNYMPAPFESAYLNLPVQQVLMELHALYRQEGYGFARTKSEQADHIAKELGYMQMFCEREIEEDDEGTLVCMREKEKCFFQDHLGRWAYLFARDLLEHAQTDFYRSVALMLQEFLDSEMELLNQ